MLCRHPKKLSQTRGPGPHARWLDSSLKRDAPFPSMNRHAAQGTKARNCFPADSHPGLSRTKWAGAGAGALFLLRFPPKASTEMAGEPRAMRPSFGAGKKSCRPGPGFIRVHPSCECSKFSRTAQIFLFSSRRSSRERTAEKEFLWWRLRRAGIIRGESIPPESSGFTC